MGTALYCKVQGPDSEEEHRFFRRGLTLATSFHAEGDQAIGFKDVVRRACPPILWNMQLRKMA